MGISKTALSGIIGTILGSLIEEGLEEVFPGLGELGNAGEITGFFGGILASSLKKEETRNALMLFIRYLHKQAYGKDLTEGASKEEVEKLAEKFKDLPPKTKEKIVSSFKNVAPYEYGFIQEQISEYAT